MVILLKQYWMLKPMLMWKPKLKPAVAKRLVKAVAETKKGVNVSPAFDNAQDALVWLRS